MKAYMLHEKNRKVLYAIQNARVNGMLEMPGAKAGF